MTITYTTMDSNNDNYPHFSDAIKERFASFSNKPLFTTDVEGLSDIFLDNLPEHARQHYNCRCCRHFLNRFGSLVHIGENGEIVSVLWDEKETPKLFAKSVKEMKKAILKARVTGMFISSDRVLGTPSSGGWSHMSVELPRARVFNSRLKTAGQEMAEKKEEFRILIAGLLAYPVEAVDTALALLQSESLYRGDRYVGIAQWVKDLHEKREGAKNSRVRDNITWLAVATAPNGFCHIKSSMIGTLLDDIVSGYDTDSIVRRFADKMNPATFQRSQTAPTAGNIQQAEKIVEKLGIANSLQRRYATLEEIPQFIWKGKEVIKNTAAKMGGVFGNIKPRSVAKESILGSNVELPQTVMTFDKFQRTVMPTADSIEVMVDNPNRLMALVTAADKYAPNILQWDNTFSWYYHGGIDGEIKRRVESAGGKYENNEIRCSLIWENYTDLDLHAITPMGRHIHFANKVASCGGNLDIDMNAGGRNSMTPVENIRWSNGKAREGRYQFFVHNFAERGNGITPFKVELEVNGKIFTFSGSLSNKQKVVAFDFHYIKGQTPTITGTSYTSADAWSIPVNGFTKVKGITESPNLWGDNKATNAGHHIFFLLEGCKDTSEGKGRGFFTETLQPELREVRKTLEAYTANTPIEGAEEASACGVGYSKDSEWNLIVKVTTGNSTRLIKIDRWD
ncbi:hypothetical protein M5X02_30905 [Paenibacillus alvei]|uniref:YfaP family protein n=1 Tax=Paenibacillus alvei TaxID=44250 RepID=UPI000289138C|nr:hypothetical protein [Paenibacillus alvei]EJW14094.1 hypothetical protein PAV_141p02000 [Paenibacillus alvei DSM 29]MCY9545037.1 hypothetical protein [Paenibacillus alvei]MCY9707757.1 hypothetical protein [Paenibacillus alvei]MEC0082730.1 hypothetical protein [Paenibacillus alvei]